MKTFLAGLLAAAAVAPASAAIVNISWSNGGFTFSGSIDIGALNNTTITEGTPGISGSMSALDGANPLMTGQPLAISIGDSQFSFFVNSDQTVATKTAASPWILSDASQNNQLAGTVGSPDWQIVSDNGNSPAAGADTLALTVVPEPEHVALAASVGLVAFGLARRRFGKA